MTEKDLEIQMLRRQLEELTEELNAAKETNRYFISKLDGILDAMTELESELKSVKAMNKFYASKLRDILTALEGLP